MPWKWSEHQQLPNLREARGVKGSQTALECHCRIGKTQNLRKLDAENEKVDTARFLRKCFGRQAPRLRIKCGVTRTLHCFDTTSGSKQVCRFEASAISMNRLKISPPVSSESGLTSGWNCVPINGTSFVFDCTPFTIPSSDKATASRGSASCSTD
jgi:hypothetical protein